MNRIIMTGVTSIVGMALIEECIKHGTEIYVIVRPDSSRKKQLHEYAHVIECDLSRLGTIDIESLPKFDVFYHFGWGNTAKRTRNDPMLQAVNIEYSIQAVRLAAKLKCRKFIGAGSQAEYGIHKDAKTGPTSIAEPIVAYGISKLAAGKLCRIEAINAGMDYAWVRIFSLYGKYEDDGTMIQTTLPKLQRNEHCPLTLGTQNWDFLYSEDAGRAFYMIGEAKEPRDAIYCLGSGQARSIRSYDEEMKEALGSTSELGFGEVPYDNGVPPSMCADIETLTNDTGWRPEVSFRDGILKGVSRSVK